MVDQAEIHRKSISDKVEDRKEAVGQFRINFAILPDKESAWQDLIRLIGDEDRFVRRGAARALGAVFSHVPDIDAAWQDLHRLSSDEDSFVRSGAASALGAAFPHVPDKESAWQDLHRLSEDEDKYVRWGAAYSLGSAFSHVPDKDGAWQDLHRLSEDEDKHVRWGAALALGSAFSHVPDKDAAWRDLHRLSGDEDHFVRSSVADALGAAFPHVPDIDAAWQDLIRLTDDEDMSVRYESASALGSAFPHLPDKDAAWEDLYRLLGDEDSSVRMGAAEALGSAFPYIPDKSAADWMMLDLTEDYEPEVRVSANHSLGKASIFKATEAKGEEDFRQELEKALEYFERSAAEAQHFNPAKFCLPFYRSFYVLTFKNGVSEAEVQKSLAEAKSASEGSKSKEDLLEAVENLSNALKETQSLRERGFKAAKCDLNSYRRYCDRAAELLDETEDNAPGATRMIKRGLPIIDQRIKDLLKDIRDKSEKICKTGGPLEAELGCRIQKHTTSALETYNPIEIQKEIDYILRRIGLWSDSIPDEDKKGYIKDNIEDAANEDDIKRRLSVIRILLEDIMSGKDTSKYMIKNSTVQIAEGEGNDQEMNVSSNPNKENHQNIGERKKYEDPWYKDRNYLIAVVGVLIAAMVFLVSIL